MSEHQERPKARRGADGPVAPELVRTAPRRINVDIAEVKVSKVWLKGLGPDRVSASVSNHLDLLVRWTNYCKARGADTLPLIDTALCIDWIEAPLAAQSNRAARAAGGNAAGRAPGDSTRSNRRAFLRRYFRTLRALDIFHNDPTIDIALPARPSRVPGALTQSEVDRVRETCRYAPQQTLLPAVVALTLASASTTEVACITVGDLHLAVAKVWVHGESGGREPRWGELGSWAVEALERRVAELRKRRDFGPATLLAYTRSSDTQMAKRTAATAGSLRRALNLAGITRPEALPISFLDYLALKIFAETGRIEAVAAQLGLRGLDRAADLAAYDWRQQYSTSEV
jgi:site-specific recombinase XerD